LPAREISRLLYLGRLCGEKEVFNLGILGILAHFRQFNLNEGGNGMKAKLKNTLLRLVLTRLCAAAMKN